MALPNDFNNLLKTVFGGAYNETTASLKSAIGDKLAGEDLTNDLIKVEQRFSSNYISTATTTVIKTGAGMLHRIVVEGGTAGTIIIYDNTAGSGTTIASFDSTAALMSYEFNTAFGTGLTIVTAAATKITVSFR